MRRRQDDLRHNSSYNTQSLTPLALQSIFRDKLLVISVGCFCRQGEHTQETLLSEACKKEKTHPGSASSFCTVDTNLVGNTTKVWYEHQSPNIHYIHGHSGSTVTCTLLGPLLQVLVPIWPVVGFLRFTNSCRVAKHTITIINIVEYCTTRKPKKFLRSYQV